MSFHLENLEKFQLYGSNWEALMLKLAGIFVILSAILDVLSTILIVGKTTWAYYWIGIELAVILVKVGCCLEPLRFTEIQKTHTNATEMMTQTPDSTALRLPLDIHLAGPWRCQMVTTSHNIFENQTTGDLWKSTTAGLSIGQNYCCINNPDQSGTKYLAKTDQIDLITLIDSPPKSEDSHALQREFLTAVSAIVATNSVPSRDFIAAIETTIENVRSAMPKFWFDYATAGLLDGISRFQGKEIFDMA